jgi:hypothetical protein
MLERLVTVESLSVRIRVPVIASGCERSGAWQDDVGRLHIRLLVTCVCPISLR